MKKVCVFCGRHPETKTKEHVIPQWLIRLTGNPKRLAFWGIDHEKSEDDLVVRKFAFDQFTTPACAECNQQFQVLEDEAKAIVETMLRGGAVSGYGVSVLLDWFDKVRVGVWLAWGTLNKNLWNIRPRFRVAQRIGAHDRMVGIYRAEYDREGLTVLGTNLPSFGVMPSCFSLLVNDLYFTNISDLFLFARRIGFPHAEKWYVGAEGDGVVCDVVRGRERKMLPLLKGRLRLRGAELYQPMYGAEVCRAEARELYSTDYVRGHSMDPERGIGKVFREEGNTLREIPVEASMEWAPRSQCETKEIAAGIVLQTLEWQLELLKRAPGHDPALPDEDRKYWERFGGKCKEIGRVLVSRYEKEFYDAKKRGKSAPGAML